MFILFGWGHKKYQDIGSVSRHYCSNCNNTSSWNLSKITTSFTLFFLPVVPYKEENLLSCPVCDKYILISDEHFNFFKNFANLNNALKEESISEDDHNEFTKKLENLGQDIASSNTDWDFDEDKLAQAKNEEKGMTLTRFIKIALPIIGILFILVLL